MKCYACSGELTQLELLLGVLCRRCREMTAKDAEEQLELRADMTATGWICPRCQAVLAPWVTQCSCRPPLYYGTNTSNLCPACWRPPSEPALTGCPQDSHYGPFAEAAP